MSAAVLALHAAGTVCSADDTNIALGKPVKASGGVSGAAANVTDGDPFTVTQPSGSANGFYYQVDPGKDYPIQAIELYAAINCCPNQLSRVRMSVFEDNGACPGKENWSYAIRPNGAANAQGGVDTLTASLNPAGVFRGRSVRITNTVSTGGTPLVGEIQVFEAPTPEVRFFGPDAGNITKTGNPNLPAETSLSWNVTGATSVTLDQGIGEVDKTTGSVTVSPDSNTSYTLTATNGAGITSRTVTIGVDQTELPPRRDPLHHGAGPDQKHHSLRPRLHPRHQPLERPAAVFYQVGPQPCPAGAVVASEIHYSPAGDGDGGFLELMNVSDAAVNLRGATFTKGITFTFPANRDTLLAPGERLVLVDSEYTFQQIQGWSAPLGGVYSGNLSDGGEQLTLTSQDGAVTIFDMTYGIAAPWPAGESAAGHSLVLMAPHSGQNLSDASHWRPSRTLNGNPNSADALAFAGNPAADADGDGLSALMEFALGTSDLVPDLSPLAKPVANVSTGLFDITIGHAAGADSAALSLEASADLQIWNYPAALKSRTLLPDGRLQSTWSVPSNLPRLFLRLHAGGTP